MINLTRLISALIAVGRASMSTLGHRITVLGMLLFWAIWCCILGVQLRNTVREGKPQQIKLHEIKVEYIGDSVSGEPSTRVAPTNAEKSDITLKPVAVVLADPLDVESNEFAGLALSDLTNYFTTGHGWGY